MGALVNLRNLFSLNSMQPPISSFEGNREKEPSKTVFLFYFPGGAMCGIYQAIICAYLERKLNAPLHKFVQFFASASAGSFTGCGLNIPNPEKPTEPLFSAKDIIRMFPIIGPPVFGQKAIHAKQIAKVLLPAKFLHAALGLNNDRFDHTQLGNFLKKHAGVDQPMTTSLSSQLVYSHNVEQSESVAHIHIDPNTLPDAKEQFIYNAKKDTTFLDAIMSSTAAITLFRSYKHNDGQHHVDMAHIDTVGESYRFLRESLPQDVKIKVVVLGTGITYKGVVAKIFDVFGILDLLMSKNGGVLFGMQQNHLAHKEYNYIRAKGDDVLIVDKFAFPQHDKLEEKDKFPTTDMTDASPATMKKRLWFGGQMIKENKLALDQLIDEMKTEYDKSVHYDSTPEIQDEGLDGRHPIFFTRPAKRNHESAVA